MQQGLDRGAWSARLIEAVREIIDHLGVAHALAFEQRKHILQIQSSKGCLRDSCKIGARAFDPQDTRLPIAKIDLVGFGRGVATSPVSNRAICPQLVRPSNHLPQRYCLSPMCHTLESFLIKTYL